MGKFLAYSGVAIFGFAFTGVLLILGTLLGGVVLQDLWGWFIVPFGLPELGLAHAIGINLIAWFLAYQYIPSKDGDGVTATITPIIYILFAWGIGAVVHSFICNFFNLGWLTLTEVSAVKAKIVLDFHLRIYYT